MVHQTKVELEAGIPHIKDSPSEVGTVEMIVRRPENLGREVIAVGEFAVGEGLLGDNYLARGSTSTEDGKAHPEAQVALMNSRAVDLVCGGERDRWPLAGDQLFVDLDLSFGNLPTGTRLQVGTAVFEVSAKPHPGCAKFGERYGIEASRWSNSDKELRLRGINAMVVEAGTVKTGDHITRLG